MNLIQSKSWKSNPKSFYSYVKKKSKTNSLINLLIDKDGQILTKSKDIADLFQKYFCSVFSKPDCPLIKEPDFTPPQIFHPLQDLNLTLEAIETAIDCIDKSSSCPEMEIPAPVLKACKKILSIPIKLIWDESLVRGKVPQHYKTQFVTPIHKKESTAFASNYRPISVTSHIVKIFERILRNHLVEYLDSNSIISSKQHGFQKGKSCLTQLLAHYDDLLSNALHGNETDVIFIDFAKAFDKIDHNLLLKKLSLYGISGKLYDWIKDFLHERVQQVGINGTLSFEALVLSGVPQGTVLGPLLFLLFINDLESKLEHSTCRFFADDTRLSKPISSLDDTLLLQKDLDNVVNWANENNMRLNEDKFEYMAFESNTRRLVKELPFFNETYEYYTPGGVCLQPTPSIKDLGIRVSNDYSWSLHIGSIVTTATKKAAWVLNTFSIRNEYPMLCMYKSLVRSHLENSCPLWNPRNIGDIQALEIVQNNFLSKINGYQNLNYWERLEKANLQSLQRRRERYCLIHMWKILNNISPNDINLQFYHNPRLGIKAHLHQTIHATSKYQSLRDQSFSYIGPKLWNTLDAEVTTQNTLEKFKVFLCDFLMKYPDKPPMPRLTYVNDNSIISYPRFLG